MSVDSDRNLKKNNNKEKKIQFTYETQKFVQN